MILVAGSKSRWAPLPVIVVSEWLITALAASRPYAWRIIVARVCGTCRGAQGGIPDLVQARCTATP